MRLFLTLFGSCAKILKNSGEQDDRENFFSIVDLHAITVPQDPKKLKEGVMTAAATYLAAGIDPAKCKVFVQVCPMVSVWSGHVLPEMFDGNSDHPG